LSEIYKEQSSYSPMNNEEMGYNVFSGANAEWDFYGLHCHDFFEFYLFFSGMPLFCVEEEVFPLRSCTLVILPPFHMHGLVSSGVEKNYDRCWLYTTPAFMKTLSMGAIDLPSFFKDCVKKGKTHFYVGADTAMKLRGIIEEIKNNSDTDEPIEKWKNCLNISEFIRIVYDIAKDAEISSKPIVINESIQNIVNYINAHFTENLSISEIAKAFGISTSYLSRSFGSYTGRSVYEYITYRRIALAKEMICASKPFTEVAFLCGFNDYSCFLRAFQKATGQTPSAYKKTIKSFRSTNNTALADDN